MSQLVPCTVVWVWAIEATRDTNNQTGCDTQRERRNMFKVTLWEITRVVGHPDMHRKDSYHLATVDTLQHARRVQQEKTEELKATFSTAATYVGDDGLTYRLVNKGHPQGHGDVYRTVFVSISA